MFFFCVDHYIVVGAHTDAWGYGGVDAGTSYAVIMDLARTFHDQFNQGRSNSVRDSEYSLQEILEINLAVKMIMVARSYEV